MFYFLSALIRWFAARNKYAWYVFDGETMQRSVEIPTIESSPCLIVWIRPETKTGVAGVQPQEL